MGHVWIFQPENNPKKNLKKQHTKASAMPLKSSDPNPVEN